MKIIELHTDLTCITISTCLHNCGCDFISLGEAECFKHGPCTFLYGVMGELVCSGQLWARAALSRSCKVG